MGVGVGVIVGLGVGMGVIVGLGVGVTLMPIERGTETETTSLALNVKTSLIEPVKPGGGV